MGAMLLSSYVCARKSFTADKDDHMKMNAQVYRYGAPHGGLRPPVLYYEINTAAENNFGSRFARVMFRLT